jgi:hypothetical protein
MRRRFRFCAMSDCGQMRWSNINRPMQENGHIKNARFGPLQKKTCANMLQTGIVLSSQSAPSAPDMPAEKI